MKKIFKLSALFCAAALTIVSCTKELQTAQFDEENVTLASFGPNPAMRGSTVSFYGSNLDKIVEVNVPGMEPVKGADIEVVKKGKVSQIRIVLDKETPEIGYVVLKSSDGKEFKTKSELTYKEPIVFDGFQAKDVNFPGETVTLKGTYMDLIKTVTFEGGEKVEILEGATRHEAKVVIPANAVTGKIILSDGAEIESLFYSEADLVMGEPTVVANKAASLKAGAAITIAGEHLEMIEKIAFDGAEVEDFTLAEDNASISLTLPAEAKGGVFNAVSFAGKAYKAGEFTAVVPAVASVAPTAVKAGNKLTIKGSNLDLVTKVAFDGDENPSFEAEPFQVVVTVANTVKEGDVTLTTANGTEIKKAFQLVHPTITSVSPAEIFAGDEPVIVAGKDLDLVVSAKIGGKPVEISAATETSLTLETAVTNVTGTVELTLANGETVTSASEVVMNYHSLVIVTSRPASQHIGQQVVLQGSNMKLIETIYVGNVKVTDYSLRTDDEIRFIMPWNKIGSYELKFVLYNGDTEVQAEPIGVECEQDIKTIWEGEPFAVGGWAAGFQALAWGGYDWSTVKKGTELRVYYTIDPEGDYHQIRIGNGSWAALPGSKAAYPDADGDGNIAVTEDGCISFALGEADLNELVNNGGLVVCAAWFKVTKVQLVADIAQEKTIWEGTSDVTWGGGAVTALSWGGYDWSTVEVGTQLIAYITVPSSGQIRFGNGSWAALPTTKTFPNADGDGNLSVDSSVTSVKVVLSADDINELVNNGGLVMCGTDYTITKIAIL